MPYVLGRVYKVFINVSISWYSIFELGFYLFALLSQLGRMLKGDILPRGFILDLRIPSLIFLDFHWLVLVLLRVR